MSKDVDGGKKIIEIFKKIDNVSKKTEAEVYNELYVTYILVVFKTLDKVGHVN